MLCLPLDLIPGWLFGIPVGRVKEEIRPKLLRYQRECFRALWDAFKSALLPAMDAALAPPASDLPRPSRRWSIWKRFTEEPLKPWSFSPGRHGLLMSFGLAFLFLADSSSRRPGAYSTSA